MSPAPPTWPSPGPAPDNTPLLDRGLLAEQIGHLIRAEIRGLERRGMRTQWLFFALGIPVGILINMLVK